MTNVKDAQTALIGLQITNVRLSERMRWPLWRHAAAGLLMTLIVVSVGLPRGLATFILLMVIVLTIAIVRDDKKRYGMFVSGYQRGRAAWVTGAIIALNLSAVIFVRTLVDNAVVNAMFWLVVAIVFLGTSMLSIAWERVYRHDIREGGR